MVLVTQGRPKIVAPWYGRTILSRQPNIVPVDVAQTLMVACNNRRNQCQESCSCFRRDWIHECSPKLSNTTCMASLYPLVLFKARQIERMSTGRLAIFTYTYTRLGLAVPYLSRFLIASKQKTASCLSPFLTSSPFFHSLFSPNLLPHTHIHHSICKFQVPVT
jgi:hypothetical protein